MADFVTTLHYPLRADWCERAEAVTADGPPPHELIRRLLRASRRTPLIVIDGFGTAERIAAMMILRRRRPPTILITDCTWKVGDSLLERVVTRVGVRALRSRHTVFCVGSSDEYERFPQTWGVDPERVRILRWFHVLTEDEMKMEPAEDGPIFSGGQSMRDYRALLAVAPGLPLPVLIAAGDTALPAELPANVEGRRLSHEEYQRQMLNARLVVVPLEDRRERAAGQSTYLSAMAFGKLVVVTDTTGVRDHVEHMRTGLIIPPNDAPALREAIEWALDPANAGEVAAIRAQARETARTRFRPEHYVEDLLAIADELLAAG